MEDFFPCTFAVECWKSSLGEGREVYSNKRLKRELLENELNQQEY